MFDFNKKGQKYNKCLTNKCFCVIVYDDFLEREEIIGGKIMNLIKNFYRKDSNMNSNLLIEEKNLNDIQYCLEHMRFYDDTLEYPHFISCLIKICNQLGIADSKFLKYRNNKTRFSNDTFYSVGSFTFNYSNTDKVDRKNVITCYACNELKLFDGQYNEEPIIKVSNEDTSFYYAIGDSELCLVKYEVKLKNDQILTRDFFNDKVMFSFSGLNNCFTIQVEGIIELNNELLFVEYLKGLNNPYDIVNVYNKLCEISIGNELDKYPMISLTEYKKSVNNWKMLNSISIKNGQIDNVIRTSNGKTISCDGKGNWSYVLEDKDVTLSISSSDKTTFNIVAKNDDTIDEYVNGLLKHDVGVARKEANDFKVRIKRKLGF